MSIFIPWLIFRLLTSLYAAWISALRPLTPLEQIVPLLPPSLPLSSWLERVALSPWLRWDAVWYQRIVDHGYDPANGTAQFHPLYPWLAKVVAMPGTHPLLALLLVSSLSSLGFLYIYHRLAQVELSGENARFSLLLILLAPTAFIFFAPYPEALFLLCAASSFLFAHNLRWWLAGMAAGLATLTRQQGIFLFFPLAYMLWEAYGSSWDKLKHQWVKFLSLSLIPISYAAWIIYRSAVLGDLSLKLSSLQSLIYSLFISPSATEVVPQQSFVWPWQAIGHAIQKVAYQPDADIWVNIILAVIFLLLLCISWKRMRPAFRLYSVIIFLISFSYYTGPIHPYMGLPRHLLLAFPVFIYASPRLNKAILRPAYLTLMGSLYLFQIYLYVMEAWIP